MAEEKPAQPHHTKIFKPKSRRTSRQHPLQQIFTNAHAAAKNRTGKISLAPIKLVDEDGET